MENHPIYDMIKQLAELKESIDKHNNEPCSEPKNKIKYELNLIWQSDKEDTLEIVFKSLKEFETFSRSLIDSIADRKDFIFISESGPLISIDTAEVKLFAFRKVQSKWGESSPRLTQ